MAEADPVKKKLDGNLAFAQAVYRISSSFVSLAGTDTIISEALRVLGEVCQASRTYVFLFDHSSETMNNTHEWCSPGVDPQIDFLTDLPNSLFPWWLAKLKAGEMILVPEVAAMPAEASAERDILQQQSVTSVLVLPIYEENILAGFIGLDDVTATSTWEDTTREYLHVASDMVSSTITRARRAREAEERRRELEEAYDNLKQAQAQLLQAEKLASVGALAAGVAHEINNPVGYIKSNTLTARDYFSEIRSILELLHTDRSREEIAAHARERGLEFILNDLSDILTSNIEGIERIIKIVNNLMTFSRASQLDRHQPADIRVSIRSALAIANSCLSSTARVVLELEDIPETVCDINELSQVFLNILSNAAQSLEEQAHARGGAERGTEPGTEPDAERGTVTVRTWTEGGAIHCTVRDTGPGIPESALPRIFEPFFTTRDVGKGTGLGMSIAYDIVVNKHGGTITAENNEKGGACFHVSLPIRRSTP